MSSDTGRCLAHSQIQWLFRHREAASLDIGA